MSDTKLSEEIARAAVVARDERPDYQLVEEWAERVSDLERRLRQAERAQMALLEEWQDASGLCSPPEEEFGDPGGVTPQMAKEYWEQVERERDELRNQRDDMKRELALRDTTEAMLGQQSAELRARRAVEAWVAADPDERSLLVCCCGTTSLMYQAFDRRVALWRGPSAQEMADALGLEWRE